jgi:hypothetical protein
MQEIPRENLVPGKEYYLQSFEESCLPPHICYKMIGKFEKLEESSVFIPFMWACFTNFRKIENRNETNYNHNVMLNYYWKFYEIVRNKVQKNMENRSYNMILLDLIQDEYFKPIDVIN